MKIIQNDAKTTGVHILTFAKMGIIAYNIVIIENITKDE